jgi:hypothetical protein
MKLRRKMSAHGEQRKYFWKKKQTNYSHL